MNILSIQNCHRETSKIVAETAPPTAQAVLCLAWESNMFVVVPNVVVVVSHTSTLEMYTRRIK